MQTFTNEPPEDLNGFLKNLKLYVDKSLKGSYKTKIQDILRQSSCNIIKTGEWGSRWGYAEAKIIFIIPIDKFGLIDGSIRHEMIVLSDTLLQGTNCGLEISKIDFVPQMDTVTPTVEDELNEIVYKNEQVANNVYLPDDLVSKGRQMSEAYLYIYFVENYLRLFIEKIQENNSLAYSTEVKKTIEKNKANEQQNKFLPLRGNSDLYYCDFVQLQQIIIGNWEIFKNYFPQQDQHWLRVKVEDMYRVRNLIAHCGYVSIDELNMVKANFKMIIGQLKF